MKQVEMPSTSSLECVAITFDKLPLEVRYEVFKKLGPKEHAVARLVCKNWLQILNQIKKPTGILTNHANHKDFLDMLTHCTWKEIGVLQVQNLTKDFATYSASRILLPPSNQIILGSGNSSQNIIDLLRFYCNRSTNRLTLTEECFSHFAMAKKQLDLSLNFTSLSSLSIFVTGRPTIGKPNLKSRQNHMIALTTLVTKATFPALTTFSVQIEYYNFGADGIFVKQFEPGFDKFMVSHGAQLKNFSARLSGLQTSGARILKSFDRLTNVQNLTILCDVDSDLEVEAVEFAERFKNTLTSFSKLCSLQLFVQISYFDLVSSEISYVTQYNHEALKLLGPQLCSLRFVEQTHEGLKSWLHSTPKNFANLTTLNLVIDSIIETNPFQKFRDYSNKLHKVKKLVLEVNELDVHCIEWIKKMFPNLKDFVLDCPIKLNQLMSLWSIDSMFNYITWRTDGDGEVMEEVKNWCEVTNGVQLFYLKSVPSEIALNVYNEKNTNNYACLRLNRSSTDQ